MYNGVPGNVYIRIHGGLVDIGLCSSGIEVEVGLDGKQQRARMFGRQCVAVPAEYHELTKGLQLEHKWLFGALASWDDQSTGKLMDCWNDDTYEKNCRNDGDMNEKKGDSLYTKVKRNLWNPIPRKEEMKIVSDNQQLEAEISFTMEEITLNIEDYLGTLPLTFSVSRIAESGNKTLVCDASIPLSSSIFRESSYSKFWSFELPSKRKCDVNLGTFETVHVKRNRKKGEPETCGFLIMDLTFVPRKKIEDHKYQLHQAIAEGKRGLVVLITENLRKNQITTVITQRCESMDNMNLFELAAWLGRDSILEYLLNKTTGSVWDEWNKNSALHGRTALHLAVLANNYTGLHLLSLHAYKYELTSSLFDSYEDHLLESPTYERSRSRRVKSTMLNMVDEDGLTPFALACSLDCADPMPSVLSLFEFDPPVSCISNRGQSPLHLASIANQLEVVLFLLNLQEEAPPGGFTSCRAKPNLPDDQGNRAIHIAAQNGNNSIVLALLESGALPSLRSKDGSLPLHLAALNGHLDVIKTLLDWPAQYEIMQLHRDIATPELVPVEIVPDPRVSEKLPMEKQNNCCFGFLKKRAKKEPIETTVIIEMNNTPISNEAVVARHTVSKEALLLRDPGLQAIQWRSGKDAASLALDNNHIGVYEYLVEMKGDLCSSNPSSEFELTDEDCVHYVDDDAESE